MSNFTKAPWVIGTKGNVFADETKASVCVGIKNPFDAALIAAAPDMYEALERVTKIAELVTVEQVINAGDEYINAARLNPYAINEGLATGKERLLPDIYALAALAKARGEL